MTDKPKTLAEELTDEAEALRRRHVHATRPKGPLSLDEAIKLSKQMEIDPWRSLREAIGRYGKDSCEAKTAAVQYCKSRNIDPHFKLATQRPVNPTFPRPGEVPKNEPPSYYEQWQSVIAEALP